MSLGEEPDPELSQLNSQQQFPEARVCHIFHFFIVLSAQRNRGQGSSLVAKCVFLRLQKSIWRGNHIFPTHLEEAAEEAAVLHNISHSASERVRDENQSSLCVTWLSADKKKYHSPLPNCIAQRSGQQADHHCFSSHQVASEEKRVRERKVCCWGKCFHLNVYDIFCTMPLSLQLQFQVFGEQHRRRLF
jgi:hypothetical protein